MNPVRSLRSSALRILVPILFFSVPGCYSFEPVTGDTASLDRGNELQTVRIGFADGATLTADPGRLLPVPAGCGVTYIRSGTRTTRFRGGTRVFAGILPDSLVDSTRSVSDATGRTARRWYLMDSTLVQADDGAYVVAPAGHERGFLVCESLRDDGESFSGFVPESSITHVEIERLSPVRSVVFGAIGTAALAGFVIGMHALGTGWHKPH